jgi:hypothetical protein
MSLPARGYRNFEEFEREELSKQDAFVQNLDEFHRTIHDDDPIDLFDAVDAEANESEDEEDEKSDSSDDD